jgi:hypothetical protein
MLQGDLDPATPITSAVALRDAYRAPAQTFIEFPTGAHGIQEGTPLSNGGDCGRQLVLHFLDDLHATPDVGCVSQVLPIDFGGQTSVNQYLLGVADGWDG